jgi:hypothetical protein
MPDGIFAMTTTKYTTDEIVRLGQERYDREIRPLVETGNRGKMLAVDIESGDYEMGEDS